MANARPAFKVLLHALSGLLFVIGGSAFWVGGIVINEVAKVGRALSEFLGLAVAAACIGLGLVAKTSADGLDEDSPTS